jgi:hypothetical protein
MGWVDKAGAWEYDGVSPNLIPAGVDMQYVTWVTHPGSSLNPTKYATEVVDSPAMDKKVSILRKWGVPFTIWYIPDRTNREILLRLP